jgi:hypothetical protein
VARIEVTVTGDTKVIMGVTCIVVRDTVSEGGKVVEDTYDWYAQDLLGNVWYFGEATKSYDGGKVSTAGSWKAGVNGAQPGIVMKAIPVVGPPYRQEYLEGEAEDMAQIIGVGESVTVPFGSFIGCVRTKDWTPLEPGMVENKWFCPTIGEVRSEIVEGGSETVELLSVTH